MLQAYAEHNTAVGYSQGCASAPASAFCMLHAASCALHPAKCSGHTVRCMLQRRGVEEAAQRPRARRRMNFIAGVILMHVPKEADAFDTLDVVIRSNM